MHVVSNLEKLGQSCWAALRVAHYNDKDDYDKLDPIH